MDRTPEFYSAGCHSARELMKMFGRPGAVEWLEEHAPKDEQDAEANDRPIAFWVGMQEELAGVGGTA